MYSQLERKSGRGGRENHTMWNAIRLLVIVAFLSIRARIVRGATSYAWKEAKWMAQLDGACASCQSRSVACEKTVTTATSTKTITQPGSQLRRLLSTTTTVPDNECINNGKPKPATRQFCQGTCTSCTPGNYLSSGTWLKTRWLVIRIPI